MWPDKESEKDYLNYRYMVDLVVDIATNKSLSPSTIGLYGDWGSGKSTLMKLAQNTIEQKAQEKIKRWKKKDGETDADMPKTLCVEFNGWLFEGYEDTKTSLCGTILDALADEKRFGPKVVEYAKELRKKIDFKKIVGKGIKYSLDYFLTSGIGVLTDLTLSSVLSSIKTNMNDVQAKDIEEVIAKFKKDERTRTEIKNFREEFSKLLKDSKVENLVVFIDELDRCLPDTILEIFEAIRLFLYVDGMSFVIGADERLIQFAIKTKYKEVPGNNLDIGKEYLEKVIQYPISIPQLNHAEVNQYLSCLLLEKTLIGKGEFDAFLKVVHSIGPDQELTIELLEGDALSITEKCKSDIAFAKQISSVLAPSINGNPRQCKRFLNTLYMRMDLAKSRGIELNKNILAKLLLAEYFKPDFFDVLVKEANRDNFTSFEKGDLIEETNPFAVWKDDTWVKTWNNNGTIIGNEKLDKYVYFANVKGRYVHSKLDMLSPTAKKCFDLLASGTDSGRNNGVKMAKGLSAGENAIIVSELFVILETAPEMNNEALRSFADVCIEVDMSDYALKKLMELPAEKYTYESYGQLTTFLNKLDEERRKQLVSYLSSNQQLNNTIQRTNQLTSSFKKKK